MIERRLTKAKRVLTYQLYQRASDLKNQVATITFHFKNKITWQVLDE